MVFKKEPPKIDPLLKYSPDKLGPVLLSDQIEFYCDRGNLDPPLIEDFSKENLKPARYNLRLGGIAHVEGRRKKIDDINPLVLGPHEVAVVQTFERINLPRFLIGRWNLRVDMVYQGLLWVGALQVDPGWQGELPCPIYNLANRIIVLRYKEKVFSIDFVRTTSFQEESREDYPYKSLPYVLADSVDVAAHDKYRLQSAVSETEQTVKSIRGQLFFFATAGISAIAILFAALGVLSTASIGKDSTVGSTLLSTVVPISLIAFISSIIAVFLSAYAFTRSSHPDWKYLWRPSLQKSAIFLSWLIIGWGSYILMAPQISLLLKITPQWILNMPSFYGFLHLLAGVFITLGLKRERR